MPHPRKGYHDQDGELLRGVTTIIGILEKGGLLPWGSKLCTEIAWRAGKAGEAMPKWNDILYGTRDAAAEAGTLVHELFACYLKQEALPVLPDTEVGTAARMGFENARHWIENSGLKLESHERPLVSLRHRFGGTPDAIAIGPDGWVLVDFKTGGIYGSHLIQMAAYRELIDECEGHRSIGAHLIRFHREHADFSHHFFGDDALDMGWEVFKRLLEMYPMIKVLEKRVK